MFLKCHMAISNEFLKQNHCCIHNAVDKLEHTTELMWQLGYTHCVYWTSYSIVYIFICSFIIFTVRVLFAQTFLGTQNHFQTHTFKLFKGLCFWIPATEIQVVVLMVENQCSVTLLSEGPLNCVRKSDVFFMLNRPMKDKMWF